MTSHNTGHRLSSLFLAILLSFSSLTLLLVSVWFIAACALSGQAGVLLGFNYVVPATAIRFLAAIRIASGYFEKYFGHLSLLDDLKSSRLHLLNKVFESAADIDTQDSARTLQTDSEQWAGRWAGLYNPMISSVISILGLTFVLVLLLPQLMGWWLSLVATLSGIGTLFAVFNYRLALAIEQSLTTHLDAQHQWLSANTLWHLRPGWIDGHSLKTVAQRSFHLRHKQLLLFSVTDSLSMAVGLSWSLMLCITQMESVEPMAIWAVPIVLAASVRDWFSPLLTSAQQSAKHLRTQHRLAALNSYLPPKNHERPQATITLLTPASLRLSDFQWQRTTVCSEPISLSIQAPGLYFVTSASGMGKSSLFYALTGELNYLGKALINNIELNHLSTKELVKHVHHAEQFAHIFADTLAENLRMARPDADDDELYSALVWAGLEGWANKQDLATWLGREGRPISGGEQKRLILARAYLSNAAIWLLDEPFEGLDDTRTQQISDRLQVESQHRIILLASHIWPENLKATELPELHLATYHAHKKASN